MSLYSHFYKNSYKIRYTYVGSAFFRCNIALSNNNNHKKTNAMETQKLDKQKFAKFIFSLAVNQENYYYDCFYDIVKFRKVEELRQEITFFIYSRSSGFDSSLIIKNCKEIINEGGSLHEVRLRCNTIAYECKFTPCQNDFNSDTYEITQIK